jgi:hypothetical protein
MILLNTPQIVILFSKYSAAYGILDVDIDGDVDADVGVDVGVEVEREVRVRDEG